MSNNTVIVAATATAIAKAAKKAEKRVAPAIARALAINSARNVAAHDPDYKGAVKAARIDLQAEDTLTSDSKGIVRKGAFASNAYGATRGAAQAINNALAKAGNGGMAVADLIEVAAAALPPVPVKVDCEKALKDRAVAKVVEHLKGLFFESDAARAATSGLMAAVAGNGHAVTMNRETGHLSIPAVTFDGVEWNGLKGKAMLGVSGKVAAPLLVAMHRKAAKASK